LDKYLEKGLEKRGKIPFGPGVYNISGTGGGKKGKPPTKKHGGGERNERFSRERDLWRAAMI